MKKLSKDAVKLRESILKEFVIDDEAGKAILYTALMAYDLMNNAQAVVDSQGLTVQGDRGSLKSHPLLATIRDARSQFLMGLKHLNLDVNTK